MQSDLRYPRARSGTMLKSHLPYPRAIAVGCLKRRLIFELFLLLIRCKAESRINARLCHGS